MFEISDLKSIVLFSYLEDSMLEKILPVTSAMEYGAGAYIFREGDRADRLFSVIEGEAALELAKNSSTRVRIETIAPGRTLGFSALVDTAEKNYVSSAYAVKPTKLFVWKAEDLESIFSRDPELALLFMKRIAKIIKTRLQVRNVQFLDIYS